MRAVSINNVRKNMKQMEEVAGQLKKEKDAMLKQIKDIEVPNVTKQQEEDFKAFVESLGLSM